MAGAGAVVTRKVRDQSLVVGNPAAELGWISRHRGRLGSDLVCPARAERYRETGDGIVLID